MLLYSSILPSDTGNSQKNNQKNQNRNNNLIRWEIFQFTGSDGWITPIIIIIGSIYFLKGPTQPSPHTKPTQKLNATEMGSSIHRQAGRASAPAALMQNCKQIFFHNKKNDLVLLLLFSLPLMGAIAGPMLVKNALSSVGLWWVSQSTVQTSQGKGKRKRTLDACKIPPASLSLSLSMSLSLIIPLQPYRECSRYECCKQIVARQTYWKQSTNASTSDT